MGSLKSTFTIFTIFTASTVFTIAAAKEPAVAGIPSFDSVRSAWTSTEGALLDRDGALIHEQRVVERGRRLAWVRLDEISPAALSTIIRAEDKRFYDHRGVDWLALSDAALDTLLFSQPRGASTISMQLAAHLDPALKPARQKRTVSQKWDQMSEARELEKTWTKSQILEAYLNLSTFRGELQGIGAAARSLFRKAPAGLDRREALLLAVLLRGPNAQPQAAAKRACALARNMKFDAPCGELQELASAALPVVPGIAPLAALAPHVARELLSAERPRVQTTLDSEVQAFAVEVLNQQLIQLADRNVADGAVLVVDNRTGEVLAYVGNAGERASAFYVDGVRAPRQAGSTLKPFLYELAIEEKILTAASLTDDSPVNLVTPAGLYVPQNYDRDFKGLTSVRTALSSSLNVPAVRTLMLVGTDAFVERLRTLGFDAIREDGDYYGFSLALGSAEVSLWQLTNAYRTLANGGLWSPLRLQRALRPAQTQVADPAAAWVVADILSDPLARSVTFGLDNPLASRHHASVKTGTSKDMRDNWCIGFTDRYTVGVWVGNFDGSAMRDVSGVTGAAPVWLELVNFLHRHASSRPLPAPGSLVTARVDFEQDIEPAREEYFLAGTESTFIAHKPVAASRVSIAYPGNGTLIALDPDMPADVQRVRFVAAPAAPGYEWSLDGEDFSEAGNAVFWPPQPGRHVLALKDTEGVEVDRVQFEVRGAPAR